MMNLVLCGFNIFFNHASVEQPYLTVGKIRITWIVSNHTNRGTALMQLRPDSAMQRPDRLSYRTMASRGAAEAALLTTLGYGHGLCPSSAWGWFVGRRAA